MNAEFIENILERGTVVTDPPAREEFGRLFRANHVSIHRCDTFAYDAAGRLEYLRELVGKYGLLKEDRCLPDSFICISASPEHPLTMEEAAGIGTLVTAGHDGEHRIWIKSDTSCGDDLRVDIAYYEQNRPSEHRHKRRFRRASVTFPPSEGKANRPRTWTGQAPGGSDRLTNGI